MLKLKYRKLMNKCIEKVKKKDSNAAYHLSFYSDRIFKINKRKGYKAIVDSIMKTVDVNYTAARELAMHSAEILECSGVKGCYAVTDAVLKVSKISSWIAGVLPESTAAEVLEAGSVRKYKKVIDAVMKVVDKNEELAWKVYKGSPRVLRETNGKVSVDHFLIGGLYTLQDAQITGPMISKKNLDLYNEKVQKFY